MLKKRIIPCLDIQDGRVVKGVHFKGLRDAGDPVELARRYADAGADELCFLDISATVEKRQPLSELIRSVARVIDIPFTVGGGIKSVESAVQLLDCGADKISLNSAAVRDPQLIRQCADQLGSQAVVVAIDVKPIPDDWMVYLDGGRTPTNHTLAAWARQAVTAGAGELLVTSMGHDGTGSGFALDAIERVTAAVRVPVIASGGAGTAQDFASLFLQTHATGALAATVFHYGQILIPELKQFLQQQNIPLR